MTCPEVWPDNSFKIKTILPTKSHLTVTFAVIVFTCVVKQAGDEGAVPEECVCGGDVLKVALLKHWVFKHHGLHLQAEEPVHTNFR